MKTFTLIAAVLCLFACATTDYNDQGKKIKESTFDPVPTIEAVTDAYEVYDDKQGEDKSTKEGE